MTHSDVLSQMPLSAALDLYGIKTKPSAIEGRRDWYDKEGLFLGSFDAFHGWRLVRAFAYVPRPREFKFGGVLRDISDHLGPEYDGMFSYD